jgi:hypothetical protein
VPASSDDIPLRANSLGLLASAIAERALQVEPTAFRDRFEQAARRRLGELQPAGFTRMGVASRHSVEALEREESRLERIFEGSPQLRVVDPREIRDLDPREIRDHIHDLVEQALEADDRLTRSRLSWSGRRIA